NAHAELLLKDNPEGAFAGQLPRHVQLSKDHDLCIKRRLKQKEGGRRFVLSFEAPAPEVVQVGDCNSAILITICFPRREVTAEVFVEKRPSSMVARLRRELSSNDCQIL